MFQGNVKLGGGRLLCMVFAKDGIIYAGHTCGGNTKEDRSIVTKLDVNNSKPKPKPQKLVSVIDSRCVSSGSWIGMIDYIELQENNKLLFVFSSEARLLDMKSDQITTANECNNFPSITDAINYTISIQGEHSIGVYSNDKKYIAKGIRQPGTENFGFYPPKHMGWLQIQEVKTNKVVFEEKLAENHHFGTIAFHQTDDSYIALASGRSSDLWVNKWK
jgi:hypothetical protein